MFFKYFCWNSKNNALKYLTNATYMSIHTYICNKVLNKVQISATYTCTYWQFVSRANIVNVIFLILCILFICCCFLTFLLHNVHHQQQLRSLYLTSRSTLLFCCSSRMLHLQASQMAFCPTKNSLNKYKHIKMPLLQAK